MTFAEKILEFLIVFHVLVIINSINYTLYGVVNLAYVHALIVN